MMTLAHPRLLWLFLIFVPLIAWHVWKMRHGSPSMRLSSTQGFSGLPTSWKVWGLHLSFALKLGAVGCLIVILCRPQTYDRWATSEAEGTDIVIALDISASMQAKDFSPNRLEAAKKYASQFAAKRLNDNIGLVIFAGDSFTLVPMTTDNARLVNAIEQLNVNMLDADGTAIGDGIATAINRIRHGKAKSKSIILLTDGTNNTGIVAPLTAAEIAQRDSIKIYTIGIGTNGTAPYPTYAGNVMVGYQNLPVTIDEGTLRQIAQMTGGKYWRATGNGVLQSVFSEIDKLEKTKIDVQNFSNTTDNYMPWAWLLLLLLVADAVLNYTVLRRIP